MASTPRSDHIIAEARIFLPPIVSLSSGPVRPQIDVKITEAEISVNIEQQHRRGGCGMVDVKLDGLVNVAVLVAL
jgi:hypothetical protein